MDSLKVRRTSTSDDAAAAAEDKTKNESEKKKRSVKMQLVKAIAAAVCRVQAELGLG